ncbi:hypothetical protein WJX84_008820 [Apatococcus fuscideae]|uniref:Methyltransferase type 11 domain-containing protein n=1 Tax=Apatococcus fuscideae TaxID=2026836 RepID=A0AAW1SYH2_9CHLO
MSALTGSTLGHRGLRHLQTAPHTVLLSQRPALLLSTSQSPPVRSAGRHSLRQISIAASKQAGRSKAKQQDKDDSPDDFHYACPICQQTEFSLSSSASRLSTRLHCPRCSRTYISKDGYTDLTLSSGIEQRSYQQSFWAGTEIFRSPLISYVYERGWRQGFSWAGFPGAAKETQMALDYLRPANAKVLLDLSCGSGLFSRRFLQSGQFEKIIASDFSEQMLQQASRFFFDDVQLDRRRFMLVRADAGRLPFKSGSLGAIHAGAAMHCWPDPTAAMAEISRVLRPGGVYVASTFMTIDSPLGQLLGDDNIRPLNQLAAPFNSSTYKWWSEPELRDLMATVGLQGFQRYRNRQCILFTVQKPAES